MFNILSNITLRNITTAGVVLTVVIYLCTSCRNNHAEVERIIRNHLEPTKELYALALQTGEVTLPLGGKYPHVTYPAPGGTETPISNVWIVNGNYMGKTYECHGCDSCMKCYQDAGLITYNIVRRDSTSVRSIVCLTEKETILNRTTYFRISPYYQCLAPKRATGSSTGGQRKV